MRTRGYNFETKTWDAPLSLDEIFAITIPSDLAQELRYFILQKQVKDWRSLTGTERLFYSLGDLLEVTSTLTYYDIFFQTNSLAECRAINKALDEMNLPLLAGLFAEALSLYCRRQNDLSEDDFSKLEPFDMNDDDQQRFDDIGQLFQTDHPQLRLLADRLGCYATEHRNEFEPSA